MKIWKKNVIAAAVLVTVCAGIYVNWTYSNEQASSDLVDTLDAEKVMSDDLLILDDALSAGAAGEGTTTVEDYFAAVKLSRQEARDSAVSLLQEAMAYTDAKETSAPGDQLDSIVQTALSEAQVESLVIAKGFADCVAYMSDEGISVAVASPEGGLQQTDVAVITDIVLTQTDYGMEEIRVVEVQ